MSTYYFVGGELNAVSQVNPQPVDSPIQDSANSLAQPSGEVRGCVIINTAIANWFGVNYIDPATGLFLTSGNGLRTFWSTFTWSVAPANNGSANETVSDWRDASNVPWFRIVQLHDGGYDYDIQYWNGTVWTSFGFAPVLGGFGQIIRWDLAFNLGSSGSVQVFCQNLLIGTFSHDFSASGPIVQQQFGSTPFTASVNNIIVSDTTTREHNIRYRGPTGNGAEQQWTGDYTNIDEFPELTSDIIYTGTAAQASTFTHATFASDAPGKIVKAVAIGALMRRDPSGGPQNAKMRLTIGGTDYDKDVQQPEGSYLGRIAIWNVDPSTGLAWDGVTDVNGPFGPVSVA